MAVSQRFQAFFYATQHPANVIRGQFGQDSAHRKREFGQNVSVLYGTDSAL